MFFFFWDSWGVCFLNCFCLQQNYFTTIKQNKSAHKIIIIGVSFCIERVTFRSFYFNQVSLIETSFRRDTGTTVRHNVHSIDSVNSSVVNILKLKFSLYIVQSIALHSEKEMMAGLGAKTSQYIYSENIWRRICDASVSRAKAQRAPKSWSWFPLSLINCVEVLPRRGQTSRFHTFFRSVESVLTCLFLNPFHQKRDRLFFRAGAGKTTKQQPHVELDGNFCSSPPVLSGSGPRGRTAAHDAITQESCSPCCVLAAALMSWSGSSLWGWILSRLEAVNQTSSALSLLRTRLFPARSEEEPEAGALLLCEGGGCFLLPSPAVKLTFPWQRPRVRNKQTWSVREACRENHSRNCKVSRTELTPKLSTW